MVRTTSSCSTTLIAEIIDLYLIKNYRRILNRKTRERERDRKNLLEIKKMFFLFLKYLTYLHKKVENKDFCAFIRKSIIGTRHTQCLVRFHDLHNLYISFALYIILFCSFKSWIQIARLKLISAIITNERNYIGLAKNLFSSRSIELWITFMGRHKGTS